MDLLRSKPILVILALAALALLTLIMVVIGVGPAIRLLGATPSPTLPAGTRQVTGLVRDMLTGQPIANAQVRAGSASVVTDQSGTFSIPVPPGGSLHISAANYEDLDAPQPADAMLIDLVRDPRATYDLVYLYQIQHEYGRQYDLLHPDAQAQFARADYIRHMERTVDYEIVARSYGEVALLRSWTFQGRVYTNTAQVPFTLTIRKSGQDQIQNGVGHLVRAGGAWRWFRGPLGQPTPTAGPTWPTATPGPVWPTPTPLPPPFPVGSWVQVMVGSLNVRQGPGANYAILTTVAYGTRLRTLGVAGPTVAGNTYWYEVTDEKGLRGWCDGAYLAPSSPPPSTPTGGPWFPVGSWVTANSPTGWLNVMPGPGPGHTPVAVAPNGTRLRIVSGPFLTAGAPWYEVVDAPPTFQGWGYGPYLSPASPPVTPTPTSWPGPFPIGSWVEVRSPDGQLNIRSGPGGSYPVTAVALNGQRLQIVGGPAYADGAAWYEVIDRDRATRGWCNGSYLAQIPIAPTLTPTWAPWPTVTPTSPVGGARFTELQFCVIPPGGGAADCGGSFRAPIYEVYIVWDYEHMQPGMMVRREWFFNGQPWRTMEQAWDYARYGAQGTVWDVKMQDSRGLMPGTYHLVLYLNGVKQQERSFTIGW